MDQKQFDALLSDAETRLRRLKVLYEQWFVGIERVVPSQARKEFEDLLARMRKEQTNNTAQRFRLQQLVQRHVTLSTHWRRITRQIEDGTYQRDLLRAKRRKQQGLSARDVDEPELDVTYDIELDADLEAALAEAESLAATKLPKKSERPPTPKPAGVATNGVPLPRLPLGAAGAPPGAPASQASETHSSLTPFAVPSGTAASGGGADAQRPRAPHPPKAPPAPPAGLLRPQVRVAAAAPAAVRGGFSQLDIDRVFSQYVAARGRNAERTDNVKRETIEKTIRQMLPQLQKKHAGKQIDFEVVVRDGRVALKPVAK